MNASRSTRQATNTILELVEEGVIDKDQLIRSCLAYMSEDEVADMASLDFGLDFDEGDDEEEFDGEDDEEDE